MNRLILGCGYLGERVARHWLDTGIKVGVITRSQNKAKRLLSLGMRTYIDNVECLSREILRHSLEFDDLETVLVSVGFDRSVNSSIQKTYLGAVDTALTLSPIHIRRIIYISTTGVYGDAGGDWVDEQTTTDPQRDGGKASLAAEQELFSSSVGASCLALRLAGIYGPDRVPFLDKLKAGEPIPAPQQGRLNLIHVDDAADIVVAASNHHGSLPPVLCVSDGNPPERGDYYREVARRIGAPAPTFIDPPANSPRAARAAASKQVRNDLMLQTFAIRLRYPDYRAGLAAILSA